MQVRDHRTDALAGAGRGAGQDMAVVIKAAAAARRFGRSPRAKASVGAAGFRCPQAAASDAPPKQAEPWVVGGAGANRMAQTRRSRPGNRRGPRASSAMHKASHSRNPSHTAPGQPVTAWRSARGSQLAGRATSNSSENPRHPGCRAGRQAAEADDHQDHRQTEDPDQGLGDGGEGAAGPRPVSALVGMGGEGLFELCRSAAVRLPGDRARLPPRSPPRRRVADDRLRHSRPP